MAQASELDKHRAITVHMKTAHGLNHNEARWIAWGVTDPGRIDQHEMTRRLRLADTAEIDDEVRAALRMAWSNVSA